MPAKINVRKVTQLTGHNASIFALCRFRTSTSFLSGAGDGWIVEWDLTQPEMGKLIAKVETQIFSLINISNTDWVVAGNMNGGIHWVNLKDPQLTRNIAHHQKGVFDLLVVDQHVMSVGGDGVLTKWSINSTKAVESFKLSNQSLRSIAYSAPRNELAVGASDHSIYFLDATTLALKHHIPKAHNNSVFTLKYHPNQTYLMSGGRDALLKVWNLDQNFQLVNEQPAHLFTLNCIEFHPAGHLFATGSRDKTLKIWDAQSFKLLKVMETVRDHGHLNSVNHLYWSDYENYLVSCSDDRSMIIWEVK